MKVSTLLIFGVICFFQKAKTSSLQLQTRDEDDHHVTLLGVTENNEMVVRDEDGDWTDPIENSCCVLNVAVQPGGIVVGVGTDNQLYEWKSRGGEWSWVGPVENTCCVQSIRTGTRGQLIGVNTDDRLIVRSTLRGGTWRKLPKGCCYQNIEIVNDGRIYGVNRNNKIKVKTDIFTGRWETLKIEGPPVRDVVHLDDDDISIGLSEDGCEIYQLDHGTMSWVPYMSLNDHCLISLGEGEDPVIELHEH
ncbi:uncharacterized protein [Ptychodera flava]|uniref:uncharacterized protein n=1 Tax=Ptychodera flava TaxID=63121 RepID=UPI00396A96E2